MLTFRYQVFQRGINYTHSEDNDNEASANSEDDERVNPQVVLNTKRKRKAIDYSKFANNGRKKPNKAILKECPQKNASYLKIRSIPG